MATKTGIVNIALARIGVERITDVDTDTVKAARVARDLYDDARDELLRMVTWNFATKRVELAQASGSGATPAFGWDYAYTLPSDYLRMISVHPSDDNYTNCEYQLETQEIASTNTHVLLAQSNTIFIRYVAQITSVALMPPMFRSLLSQKLAMDIGRSMDRPTTDLEVIAKEFRRMLAHARSIDGMEDMQERFAEPSWVTSRYSISDQWRGR